MIRHSRMSNGRLPNLLALYATALVQVGLVAANTWQIAHGKLAGVFLIGFSISFLWSWNVKRIAFGTLADRLAYALGAGTGSLIGMAAAGWWYA